MREQAVFHALLSYPGIGMPRRDLPQIQGDVIAMLREARGWSPTKLARESGVNQSNISRLEKGEAVAVRADTVLAIARALQVPMEQLFGLEPSDEDLRRRALLAEFDTLAAAVLPDDRRDISPETLRTIRVVMYQALLDAGARLGFGAGSGSGSSSPNSEPRV